MTAMTFGRRLRHLRHAAGLTQAALATAAGIDHTYLSKLECGAIEPPSERTVVRLAERVGLDRPDELLALRDDMLLLAGKIPADVRAIILAHPEACRLLREKWGDGR